MLYFWPYFYLFNFYFPCVLCSEYFWRKSRVSMLRLSFILFLRWGSNFFCCLSISVNLSWLHLGSAWNSLTDTYLRWIVIEHECLSSVTSLCGFRRQCFVFRFRPFERLTMKESHWKRHVLKSSVTIRVPTLQRFLRRAACTLLWENPNTLGSWRSPPYLRHW